uniref:SIFamide-related peptide n=2 Tax=Schizophora TaxID=43738 RepID=FAR_DELRA|nr:RecName: Full=SIFamide-related peptide; Short=SIFa; AltName: Full=AYRKPPFNGSIF-amide [Delia radicum]
AYRKPPFNGSIF